MFNDEYRLSEVQRVFTSEGLITKHILIVKQNKRTKNKRTDITAYQKKGIHVSNIIRQKTVVSWGLNLLLVYGCHRSQEYNIVLFVKSRFCCMKSLKIPKGKSESVHRRRTDNTMAKRKSTKGQTTIYKTYI